MTPRFSHSSDAMFSPVLTSNMHSTTAAATTLLSPLNTSSPPSEDAISGLADVHILRAVGPYLALRTSPVLQSRLFLKSILIPSSIPFHISSADLATSVPSVFAVPLFSNSHALGSSGDWSIRSELAIARATHSYVTYGAVLSLRHSSSAFFQCLLTCCGIGVVSPTHPSPSVVPIFLVQALVLLHVFLLRSCTLLPRPSHFLDLPFLPWALVLLLSVSLPSAPPLTRPARSLPWGGVRPSAATRIVLGI